MRTRCSEKLTINLQGTRKVPWMDLTYYDAANTCLPSSHGTQNNMVPYIETNKYSKLYARFGAYNISKSFIHNSKWLHLQLKPKTDIKIMQYLSTYNNRTRKYRRTENIRIPRPHHTYLRLSLSIHFLRQILADLLD